MLVTKEDILSWLQRRKPEHTHMIVISDRFSYEYFPIFVSSDQECLARYKKNGENMEYCKEIYDLRLPLMEQVNSACAFHLPKIIDPSAGHDSEPTFSSDDFVIGHA